MFSNSSKYAIKAILFLALNTNEKKRITIREIAEPINVPQAYIAKLLQELSRQNVISSARGPKGGFYLNEENSNQALIDIIIALNGEDRLTSCLLSLEKCDNDRPCPLHKIANPLRIALLKNLGNKSIGEIANEVKKGKAFLPL